MSESIFDSLTVLFFLKAILSLAILINLKTLFEKRHIFKFARNFKGYTFYPIIGNGQHLIGKNIYQGVHELIQRHGLPCNMWLGNDYNYITANAAEVKIILNHPNSFDKMRLYDNLKMAFENTLLMAPADIWKKQRKHYSKSFSQPILNSFVQYFYKKSICLLEKLKDAHNRDIFNIFEAYTIDSFCESIIGIDLNLQTNPKIKIAELIEDLGEIQSIGGTRLMNYFCFPAIFWIFTRDGRRCFSLIRKTKASIYDIFEQKRKTFAENPVCGDHSTPLPLMDAMLRAEGEKFTVKQIFREMFLFTTAATDTSGYTLAYTFTLLGMHPDIQDKVYQEVMDVVGCDKPIYYDDLPNLKYTERAIFEAMRILPVTPYLGRLATADIDLGTKTLPKDSNVFISVMDLHRNEDYWPDPLKYDPDRFLPEEVAKREPYAHIPFSGGPRNCIGKTYAIMLMKTAVANVVRNYEISSKYKSVNELDFTSFITMKTIHPLDCTFQPRMHD